jgi:hypothetical protein
VGGGGGVRVGGKREVRRGEVDHLHDIRVELVHDRCQITYHAFPRAECSAGGD